MTNFKPFTLNVKDWQPEYRQPEGAATEDPGPPKGLVFQLFLEQVVRLVPCSYAALFSGDPCSEIRPELAAEWRGHLEESATASPSGELLDWFLRASAEIQPDASAGRVYQRSEALEAFGLQAQMALPLLNQGSRVGVVFLCRTNDQSFSGAEIDALVDFSGLIALVLQSCRAFCQQQNRLQETQALLESTQSILGAEDLSTICQKLDSACHRLVQADRTSLYIVDHEKRQVIEWVSDGGEDEGLSYEELDAGISGLVFRTHQPVLSLDADDGIEPVATRQRRKDRGVGAIIVVPLIAQGQVIGTITTSNHRDHRKFSGHDVNLLMVLASSAAAGVNNVRMLENMKAMSARLQILSYQDALTGLFNRAYFEEKLKSLQTRGRYPVSIISLDVDRLKMVNDCFGHPAGDELLQSMAGVIREVIRTGDVAARMGGDEFGILLENVDQQGVEKVVARLRQTIQAFNAAREEALPPEPGKTCQGWSLSASIGAATGAAGGSLIEVFKVADARMYQEKWSRKTSLS